MKNSEQEIKARGRTEKDIRHIRWGFPFLFNKQAIDVSEHAINCIGRILVDVVDVLEVGYDKLMTRATPQRCAIHTGTSLLKGA